MNLLGSVLLLTNFFAWTCSNRWAACSHGWAEFPSLVLFPKQWAVRSHISTKYPCLPVPTTGQSVLTDRQNFPACLFQQLGSLFSQIGRISLPACSNNWTVCSHRSVEFPLLRPVSTTGQSVSQIGRISLPACSNNWAVCLIDQQNFPACLFQQLDILFLQIGRISLPAYSNNWAVCSHSWIEFPCFGLFQQLDSLFLWLARVSLLGLVPIDGQPVPTAGHIVYLLKAVPTAEHCSSYRSAEFLCLGQQLSSLFSQIARISLPACSNNWAVCSLLCVCAAE